MTRTKSCATCKFLLPIYCHPGNSDIGKGNMSDLMGYACTLFANPNLSRERKGIFMDTANSMCECYASKIK